MSKMYWAVNSDGPDQRITVKPGKVPGLVELNTDCIFNRSEWEMFCDMVYELFALSEEKDSADE
jgi:hypothetical protein